MVGSSESPQLNKENLPTYTLRSFLKGENVFGTLYDNNDVIYIVEIP